MEGSLDVAIPSIALAEMPSLAAGHSSLYKQANVRAYAVVLLTLFCGHLDQTEDVLVPDVPKDCSRGLLKYHMFLPLPCLP